MPRKQGQALETTTLELAKEVARANRLCRKEEEECSDAESLGSQDSDDPDYEYSSEEEEESYDSSFIDDTEEDEEETRQAFKKLAYIKTVKGATNRRI